MGERRSEYRRLADLRPNPDNVKTHDLAGIGDSVSRFGFIEQIHLDDRTGYIVSGHGRVETLLELEAAGVVAPDGVEARDDGWWVPVVTGWASRDDDEALAATIVLNRANQRGGWNIDLLLEQLDQLAADGIDSLIGVGFGQNDIDDLLAQQEEARARAAAEGDDPWAFGDQDRQVRAIMIDLPLDDYKWATATLARAREPYGVGSNAELFTALLREDATMAGNL